MILRFYRNGRKCHKTLVVRDTENIVTTFKVNQSVTATAILGEENLHPDTCYNGGNPRNAVSPSQFASPTKICQLRPFLILVKRSEKFAEIMILNF